MGLNAAGVRDAFWWAWVASDWTDEDSDMVTWEDFVVANKAEAVSSHLGAYVARVHWAVYESRMCKFVPWLAVWVTL